MLLIMVCIAATLVPLHHRLEHWVSFRLTKQNIKVKTLVTNPDIDKSTPEGDYDNNNSIHNPEEK